MNQESLESAIAWRAEGRKVAIGTVVKTWGSAPRPAGSQMAIREDGAFTGSVSGGCIEGAVIEAAQDVMKSGKVRLLHFGVSDHEAWAVGLACGGEIDIFVEPLTDA
jgi:xanthine/CO dehydrogenase XdhC/CoxF family maturation factor